MTEKPQVYGLIVYDHEQRPQDIVDKCMVIGKGLVDNLHFRQNEQPKKALKTGLFFDMIGTLSKKLSTSKGYFST